MKKRVKVSTSKFKSDIKPEQLSKVHKTNMKYGFILIIIILLCILGTTIVLINLEEKGYFDKKLDFIENPESAKVSLYVVESTDKLNEQSDKGVESGA